MPLRLPRVLVCVAALCLGLSGPVTAAEPVTLDFANAEIDAVARTMATLTGRNVVVDPRVKGTLSLTSTTPVSPEQALELFAAQLRTQGFALIEANGIVLVLPEAEAKLHTGAVSAGPARGGGHIQTQIFRLTHESANNLVPILRPLISPNNTINANPGTNTLVITDYGDNLQRLSRIIAALDVSNATGVEIVRLQHAVAADLAPLLTRLLDAGGSGISLPRASTSGSGGTNVQQVAALASGSGGDGFPTLVLPEPRSNALILRAANPARLALARSLIEQLDQPPAPGAATASGNIHVVYLKNADATKLAVTLRAALAALPEHGGQPATGGSGSTQQTSNNNQTQRSSSGLDSGPTIDASTSNQPSTGGQIQADPATNSLIISAPEPIYRQLRAVIDQLDQRRAQVYVESLIAEVRADKAAEFGIQWQGMLGRKGDSNIGLIGTNLNAGSTNLIDFSSQFLGDGSTGVIPPSAGLNLGLVHRFGSTYALSALANFLQSSGAGNVLSTPTLLTLDNEEARIVVGQNVPFVTGSYTNTGASSTSVNPFQTYERHDVGLTLRVRPQINENGTVKMVIYQETSNVERSSVNSAQGLITNKRAIESTVLVDDGAIIALGGLMEDQYTEGEDKVPGLGDIPLVGNLFKSRSRNLTKTNLMVFLRPVVVRDAAASERFSLDRYDLLRAAQQGNQPEPSAVLQINQAPVMPAIEPVRPEVWSRPAPPRPMIETVMPAAGENHFIN